MFCAHSKYETVTPPALARMSGTTMTPFSWRTSSAAGVTGWFAASSTTRALMRSAFCSLITRSSAAGTSTSTSSSSSSAFEISSAPEKPTTEPVSCAQSQSAGTSRRSARWTPPFTSVTALQRPVVEPDRDLHDQLPVRGGEHVAQLVRKADVVGGS
jgi:hypothetical protein